MLKKRIFALLVVFVGFGSWYWHVHTSQAEQKQAQSLYYYTHIDQYSSMNNEIQDIILQSYGATHFGVKELDNKIYNLDLRLQSLTDEMDKMAVPKPYQQAHEDLKSSYEKFQKVLATYNKNINKDGILTESNAKMLDAAFLPITQASDEWYAIYKETMVKKGKHGPFRAFGSMQNEHYYKEYTRTRMNTIIGEFESTLLKWVEMKNNEGYGAIYKLVVESPGRKEDIQKALTYMKIVKVPEAYSSVHQQVLNTFENYYNTINHGMETKVVDEKYLDELKGCYLDMKKASEAWNAVVPEE